MMRVALTWAPDVAAGRPPMVDTWQVDDMAAEDAGHPGPETVRTDPGPDGVVYTPLNADGTEFTARQMARYVRAAARAACARLGVCTPEQFDAECLEAMPGEDQADPDPTPPATTAG